MRYEVWRNSIAKADSKTKGLEFDYVSLTRCYQLIQNSLFIHAVVPKLWQE